MEQFSAELFCAITSLLTRIDEAHGAPLPMTDVKHQHTMAAVKAHFQAVGLMVSASLAHEIIWKLERQDITFEDFKQRVSNLKNVMTHEMKSSLFMYIPSESAKWFKEPKNGWAEVISRFPQAEIDIEESSKCFACDRYAGAVFHVMLVAEFGAIEIGRLIEINDPKVGWPSTIREMNRIVHRSKYPELKPVEQKHRTFLEQLLPIMESMEQGWRHKISHAENKLVLLSGEFSPQIAEEIIIATRAFMRRLATELP